jgi:hypothetical protein
MRRKAAVVVSSVIVTLLTMTLLAVAQQKTVAACRAEWRANKAANQAAGISERAYVAQCRGGAAPAQTTAAPAGTAAPTAAAPGQKTVAACRAEWRANKAANQAAGISERAYVAQCRGGAAPAQTTAAPAGAAAPTAAAPGQKTVAACRAEWRANKAANQAAGISERAYVAQCRGGAAPAQTTTAPAGAPPPAPTAAAPGQKTVAACRAEWRANKAANQAAGITERAYVAQCRGGAAPAQTTTAPAGAPPPAPTAAAPGQKTVAACRAEWRANKAANQAAGVTEKAYVAQCRGGGAPAQTTAAPAEPTAPTAAPAAPAPTATTSPNTIPAPARPSSLTPNQLGANEFTTEAQAKARCPAGTVVWANLPSRIYHFSDTRYYGQTKNGAYMCEQDAVAAGMRAAKNETHP